MEYKIKKALNILQQALFVFRFVNSLFLCVFFLVNIKKEPENSKSSRFVSFSFKATYVEIEQTRISEKLWKFFNNEQCTMLCDFASI